MILIFSLIADEKILRWFFVGYKRSESYLRQLVTLPRKLISLTSDRARLILLIQMFFVEINWKLQFLKIFSINSVPYFLTSFITPSTTFSFWGRKCGTTVFYINITFFWVSFIFLWWFWLSWTKNCRKDFRVALKIHSIGDPWTWTVSRKTNHPKIMRNVPVAKLQNRRHDQRHRAGLLSVEILTVYVHQTDNLHLIIIPF